MTNAEYIKIVNDPKKTLSANEIYLILNEIKNDAMEELEKVDDFGKMRWLCGDINGLEIAIKLIEHIEMR